MEPPEEVTFQLLREITDDFSNERKIGEGSFGVVYRGVTHTGEDVAVKMLKPNCDNTGSKQFKNEIYHLGMLKHQNIVQVLGYCYEIEKKSMVFNGEILLIEEPRRAICLEYLDNGSLQGHLSDEFGGLDWDTRFKIIKGTCEGLKYCLHDLEEHLYHLDLKPDNILLDKDMSPKIADFGLSRIFGKELKSTTQDPLGTLGYRPPEYIDNGEVSNKFDIFSLGVVMIRIVSGPEGYHKCRQMSLDKFSDHVRENWRHRLQKTCKGSSLKMYCDQVETCIQLALNCVEEDYEKRPDIVMITEKLNKIETDNCTNQRIKESKDITDQHYNIKLMTYLNCSESGFVDAQETSSYVVQERIVGRDEEKEMIVTSLLKVLSKSIVILPIHGIGGIGKTTLARLIYNDPKFKSYSQLWVDVTERFDLTKIRDSIVSQLSGEESCDNERQMDNCLTNLLSNKKILVVLDNLWEDNQFELDKLMTMLYNKDSNIIVLVTTRSEDIANKVYTNIQPHKILPLTNDMCWDIIKQRSGFDARDDNEQLIGIGLEIAKKCGGVALAAQSLGFTLRSMNIDQWTKVKDSDIWNLPNHVLQSLKLSYSYMAPCLKKCFAYCAIFPKGHKIVKDDLIYQWISLDFIKPTNLLSNMHICEKYIMQLLGLSFFQHYSLPSKTVAAYYEDFAVFSMHDLVHDLARSVLVDKIHDAIKHNNTGESRIHLELLDDCTESLQAFTQYPTNIRGLRFLESDKTVSHDGASSSSSAKFKAVQVCGKIGIYDDDLFSSAKDLHVLDLSACSMRKLPNSIGDLKQLRYLNAPRVGKWFHRDMKLSKFITYLSLRGSVAILALPDSIGEMEGLMYLDLSGCYRIKKLPVSFAKLTKLVHLDFSNCSRVTYVSESLKSLTNLEYLDLSNCWKIGKLSENLGCLSRLRNLNISGSSYVSSHKSRQKEYIYVGSHLNSWPVDAEVLFTLTKLECLNLSSTTYMRNLRESLNRFANLKYLNLSDSQIEHQLSRRGRSIAFENLKNLVYLDLSRCSGAHGVLDSMGSLTKLQHLNLSECSSCFDYCTECFDDRNECFDDCTELHRARMMEAIGNLTELRYLDLSCCSEDPREAFVLFLECIGNLPNLEHLVLSRNKSLTSLPDSFRSLKKLHTLDLAHCWNLRDLPSFLNEMDRLVYLEMTGCPRLDMSKHDQLNKNLTVLPNFVVHSDSHDSRSNLSLINDVNRTDLVISRLENVKSAQEARSIKLAGKDRMTELELNWTKDVERFVEDMEVLGELVPPNTLERLKIAGYNSVTFPEWVVGSIAFHLPNLVQIFMSDIPRCNSLPPLGLLPNLKTLYLRQMNGIAEINWDLCGSRRAFPRLKNFMLDGMESLKVWYTTYPGGTDVMSEFMFPELNKLEISDCPNLRLKPCPPKVSERWEIQGSDGVISSWGEGEGASQISVTSSASFPVYSLIISGCKVPMHQWRLLHYLPASVVLTVRGCSHQSSSLPYEGVTHLRSLCLFEFESMTTVQQWVGSLRSLQELEISSCENLNDLPESIGRLRSLKRLSIKSCNSITSLPESFGRLRSLKNLDIWSCSSITSLPESFGRLRSLNNLHISRCSSITSLPESIGCLRSLKKLDIRYCSSITSLPESIGCLTSLEELCIICCGRITCLPESIQQLTKLESLYIGYCQKLQRWYKTEENKAKLAHIKEKRINGWSESDSEDSEED